MAAMLLAQIEVFDEIQKRRGKIFDCYMEGLRPLASAGFVELPIIPADCSSSYHLTYICLKDQHTRDDLINFLSDRGVQAVFHYLPLHTSPKGRELGYKPGMLPVTEDISQRLLRLPMFFDLTVSDQEFIIDQVFDFFGVPS